MNKWVVFLSLVALVVAVDMYHSKRVPEKNDNSLSSEKSSDNSQINSVHNEIQKGSPHLESKTVPTMTTNEAVKEQDVPAQQVASVGAGTAHTSKINNEPAKPHSELQQAKVDYSQVKQEVMTNLNLSSEQITAVQQADTAMDNAIIQADESGQFQQAIKQLDSQHEATLQNIMGSQVYGQYESAIAPYSQKLGAVMQSQANYSN